MRQKSGPEKQPAEDAIRDGFPRNQQVIDGAAADSKGVARVPGCGRREGYFWL
jgi:hypothetical protein